MAYATTPCFFLTRTLCEILYHSLNKAVAFLEPSCAVVCLFTRVLEIGVIALVFWVPFRYLCVLWLLPVFWYAFGALRVFHHRPASAWFSRPHQSSVPRRSRPVLGHQWFRLIVVSVSRHSAVLPVRAHLTCIGHTPSRPISYFGFGSSPKPNSLENFEPPPDKSFA